MYFEVAGIQVHPLIPPLVAFAISFLASTGGLSGAFLLLPFQMSVLGFVNPAVSSTNQLYNVVAIPGGVIRYIREGRMVWPLTWIVVMGTLPGVFIGAIVRIHYLPDPTNFRLFVGLVLLFIGLRLAQDLLRRNRKGSSAAEVGFAELVKSYRHRVDSGEDLPRTKVEEFSLRRVSYTFYGERFVVPVIPVWLISLVVGVIGGTYGIGGGAIIAPLYVAFFKLPVYTVAGATLMGTFVTSVAAVLYFQMLAPFYPSLQVAPDWLLGTLFGIGGLAGTYCGARFQKFLPARLIKLIITASLMFIAGKYIIGFFRG
jgi:uncharacterized membrane protein YfcA